MMIKLNESGHKTVHYILDDGEKSECVEKQRKELILSPSRLLW